MEEFNLSKKLYEDFDSCEKTALDIEDVKEFIRLIKDGFYSEGERVIADKIIDKLAGDELLK